jgi:diamine N-acetyltransferase
MVGFVELAHSSASPDQYWIYHFFIDHQQQSKGYGKAGLDSFIKLVAAENPACQAIQLQVHPQNKRAQYLCQCRFSAHRSSIGR